MKARIQRVGDRPNALTIERGLELFELATVADLGGVGCHGAIEGLSFDERVVRVHGCGFGVVLCRPIELWLCQCCRLNCDL